MRAEPGRWVYCGSLVLASLGFLACHGTALPERTLPVETLFVGTQCGGSEEGFSARWLGDREAVAELLSGLGRTILADAGSERQLHQASPEAGLLVEMGVRPSAGYGLSLGSETLTVDGDTATVRIHVRRPPPGTVTAAVLTSPCLLVSLPPGEYSRVAVLDVPGNELTRAAVAPP